MIKQKETGELIIISAPSGCGKDTICKELVKRNKNLWISISCTTRNPRNNEKDGQDYYFITKEEFKNKIKRDEFLEYAQYNDNYYGTPKEKVREKLKKGIDVLLIIEVQGALKIKQKVKDALFIFILPPSLTELKNRLEKRQTETKETMLQRFKTAYKELNELSKYNYVVINDNAENASKKIEAIIMSEKCRVDRIEEVFLNTKEEEFHELLLDDKKFLNDKISDKI